MSMRGQATIEFVSVLPLLVVGGAIIVQALVLAVGLLIAQVSAESLAAQAAAGERAPSIAKAPISTRVRERMHVRVVSGSAGTRVVVEPPRLLPMPRLHIERDVVEVSS